MTDPVAADFGAPFEALAEGASFETRGRTITEADVVAFATQTGDLHPAHTDATWAADGPFGERIAHGMLLLSYAIGLVPLDPARVVALRRVADAVFKRPVRIGDTIRVRGRIAALRRAGEDAGLVVFAWTIVNQHDRTVARASVEALWRRDARADRAPDPEAALVPIPL
ncbi:MAG TPA: MaoC/PaaZ C-terminal domain-containing protein [Solirubrobacteraceae bacterium]|nr:MaoC/PaaZ C-terminal domain-containing protein [Solirubrobacteraceae bacterium]